MYTLALEECVSPPCRQALQYAQNDKLRNRLATEMKEIHSDSFDQNSNIHVQFTSNHEDYMHRGDHPIMKAKGCEQHGGNEVCLK